MPKCEPVECVYTDYYGGDNTRITSFGRRKKRATAVSEAIPARSFLQRHAR